MKNKNKRYLVRDRETGRGVFADFDSIEDAKLYVEKETESDMYEFDESYYEAKSFYEIYDTLKKESIIP